MDRRRAAGALLALAACIACSTAAPMASNNTALDMYEGTKEGCYYNFQHYGEGDRIMTNEPCLNCTCHNRMLMCYLRVCPFTKAIGQDCTVEKRADQCCPIVTCPDVPVDLLTSTSTSSPAEYGATGIGKQDKYGCSINGRYFPEGSKVPPTPNKPCEHCYCIRNMTTCVMQECTLHVDGCIPIYHKDVCCPVRYSCDHPEDEIPLLDDMTTTVRPTPGFLLTTTTLEPVTQASQDCVHDDQIFADGALLKTEKACEHCYCMKGDIVCVVQGCGTPMENEGKNCTSLPPRHGQCCPDTYICEGNEPATDHITELTTSEIFETTSSTPPRRGGVEGSGYRIEPDEPYTDMPIFDITETEGSGEDQSVIAFDESETVTTGSQTPDLTDEMFLTTAKMPEAKPFTSTIEPYIEQTSIPILSSEHKKPEISGAEQTTLYESKTATESSKQDTSAEDGQVTGSENKEMKTTIIIRDEKVNYITTESSKPDISAEEEQATESQNKKMETPISTQDEKVTEDLSITTKSTSDYVSSSLSDSFVSKDDQYIITTEPTLRKDDSDVITEVTTQKELKEITTEKEYYGQKGSTNDDHETIIDTTTSPQNTYHKLETAGAHDIENSFQTEQTTTKISLDVSTKPGSDKDFKESTNEYISFSTIKSDLDETTSINLIENEIEEDLSMLVSHGRIPGEGDCLLNGITYKNNTTVPSTNKCQTSCRCVSSIVKCDPIICSPPPEYENIMSNCQPVYDQAESCCPTYICDQSKETILPEVHSQMSGTDNPRPAIANECNGNECKETVDKQTPPFEQHEPCTSENCVDVVREKQPDCGENGCENAEKEPIQPIKHTEACADGKCDQATAVKPCESGDCVTQNGNTADVQSITTDEKSCENGICTTDISLENQVDDVEKECDNGNCRRKGTSEVAMKLPSTYNTENTLIDSTTEPLVSKDTTTNIKEFSSAIDSEFTTTKPDTKTDSVLEQETDNYDTSSQKIDVTMQEISTKYPEHLFDITESDLKIELENFTSMKPKVEIITEEAVEEVSTSQNAISEKEYLTTPSSHILTEPALAEANAESDQKQANTSADENTTLNEQSKTPSLDYHLTTISDLIETPKLPTTSTLEYTISDHEKDLSLTETQNEITTPQNKDTDSQITETYDTKPLVKQDEKDKEYYDKDVTTTNVLLFDSEYTTETSVSKSEDTEPKLSEKMSTKLPESNEYADKTTEGNLIYTTKNIVELVETTKQPIDNIDTQTEGKTSTEVSSVLTTPIHREGTTENNEEQELPLHVSTEQTVEYTMEEKSTTTTPEIQKYETKEQHATETPESYLTKEITSATKKTNVEEYFTELPVTTTTTKETENDLMESLNGRGTDLPVSVDVNEKQSELSPSHETDLYTTTSGIEPGSEETHTEILKPINKESTSQNTLDENISTSMPERFETETAKIVTDIPTLIITEPVKTDTGLSVVSQEKDNTEGISTVIMFDKITTQIPELFEHHLFDKKVDEVNEREPIHEITIKPDLFSTEQVEEQANIQTDSESHTHGLTTQRPHIIQTDEDMPTTQYKEYNTPVYETDFSTPKTYPKAEDNTQLYTEKSIDITKQTEQQGSDEVYNTITPTEISDVLMLTTSKKDLPVSATTMLPETSSENTQHTLVLKEEEEVTESSSPQVTEDVSIKVSPMETFNESTTPPDSEDKTTKLQLAEESVTDVPEITTKGIFKIEDVEKTTPHITDVTFSHDVLNKVEEDIYSKVITMSNAPITDKPTPGYSEIVTQDDSKSPDSYDTKATTDISEMPSSHMVTESEILDDLHITVINEQEEKTTKEPANDQQIYTEATEIITEDNDLTLQDKDKTIVVSDLSIPPKSKLSESEVYKASEAPSTQNDIQTTEIPNLNIDEQHIITEESEQTSLTTPVASIQLEDNMNKMEETTVKVITELPKKATETEGNEQVTDILVATEKLEYDTEKTSASPADEYIEKVTETSGQAYTGEIIAESQGKTTEFAEKDIIYSTVAPQQEVTVFKEIVTEVNDVHEKLATITPDLKITEGMHLLESETEGASGLSKLDKEIFTEITPQGGTEKLATPTLETSTKQLPVSLTVNNEERSTPAGEAATVIVYTELPQLVTDNIRDTENIHKDHKLTEVSENIATTTSKLPEDIEKEKEVTNIHYQDKTTETPEKYTFESTTLISEHHDVGVTTEKSFNVPEESSSYIETTTDNKNDRLSEEKYATSFTEIPETLLSKPADIDKNKISIETLLIDSTTKSPVSFPDTSITKTTESAVGEDKNDLSENFMPNTSFEFTHVTGKPDQGKTVTAVPDLHATQHSVSDVPDVATESIWTAKYETTPKTDVDEITSDEDKVKVSTSSEDKISTDTTEKYTKSSEETFTEIDKDSLVTDHDIFTTEKSKITDEPFTHENYAAFTTTTESPKTHLEELETKLSVFSSTESHLSGSTEELHTSDGQIDITKAPEGNQYSTESSAIDTHVSPEQTIDEETIRTESPATQITSSDGSQDSHVEDINLPKETNITELDLSTKSNVGVSVEITTESNVLETKPIDETSKLPEYPKETSKPKYEYAESTPYFVELEEHTHKSIQETEATPEVYHEEKTSTLSSEVQFTVKEQIEITTSKQIILDQEKVTEDLIKETELSTKADQEKTTPATDLGGLDIFHSTSAEQSITTERVITPTKHTPIPYNEETSTHIPILATTIYNKQETPKYDVRVTTISEKENSKVTNKPHDFETTLHETSAPEKEEFIPAVSKTTTTKITEDVTTLSPIQFDNVTKLDEKPIEAVQSTPHPELPKPSFNEVLPTDDLLPTDEDNNFPPTGTSGYGQEPDYIEEDQAFGPGTCRYGGKAYISAQQIPRDDPCDFCFCFRSDIICLQQSCPPPIHGCHEEPIQGFCCPRYECPVSMATTLNVTTTTTTTTTTLPPHFLPHAYKGAAQRRGCQIKGHTYKVGEVVRASSGPCLHCTCGGDGQMKCDPKACTPEPMLRQMIAAAVSAKRRR